MNYAPKERTYSMSMSLVTRIKITAAIQPVGHVCFWTEVLKRLGISIPSSLLVILKKKDQQRQYKREYSQRVEIKRKRMEKMIEDIKRGVDENKRAAAEDNDNESSIAIEAKNFTKKTSQSHDGSGAKRK